LSAKVLSYHRQLARIIFFVKQKKGYIGFQLG